MANSHTIPSSSSSSQFQYRENIDRNRTEPNRTQQSNAEQHIRQQHYYCNIIALAWLGLAYRAFSSSLFERHCSTLGVMIMLLVMLVLCEDKTLFVRHSPSPSFSFSFSHRCICMRWLSSLLAHLTQLNCYYHWILFLYLRLLCSDFSFI